MPHDALIIGGSYAGLSAAMQLVRARRRVLVIDDGRPRNRFAARAHGVLTNDGKPGAEVESWVAVGTHAFDEPTNNGPMRHDPELTEEALRRFRAFLTDVAPHV
ncbi:MAG: FAD-dependent oxidoreductase [Brevundimonas sp.]|nr:MAG: FAD-dependent oxidoreductase [Brevundimonas sp.]